MRLPGPVFVLLRFCSSLCTPMCVSLLPRLTTSGKAFIYLFVGTHLAFFLLWSMLII